MEETLHYRDPKDPLVQLKVSNLGCREAGAESGWGFAGVERFEADPGWEFWEFEGHIARARCNSHPESAPASRHSQG